MACSVSTRLPEYPAISALSGSSITLLPNRSWPDAPNFHIARVGRTHGAGAGAEDEASKRRLQEVRVGAGACAWSTEVFVSPRVEVCADTLFAAGLCSDPTRTRVVGSVRKRNSSGGSHAESVVMPIGGLVTGVSPGDVGFDVQLLGIIRGLRGTRAAVGWSVSAGLGSERGGPCDRLFFELGVGVLVDAGGLDALVPEPQRDRRDVDVLGSQQHRVGVT